MTTLCTKDKSLWFTDEEKKNIAKKYHEAYGCRISNLEISGFDRSVFVSGYPMDTTIYKPHDECIFFPQSNISDITADVCITDVTDTEFILECGSKTLLKPIIVKRNRKTLAKLGSCEIGSGHDAYLKGITIQFSLDYPVWLSPQIQRYSHIFYVSSTSAMQRISDLKDISKYVDPMIANSLEVQLMQDRINIYKKYLNDLKAGYINAEDYRIIEHNYKDAGQIVYSIMDITEEKFYENTRKFTKEEFYHYIISICPQGLMKTVDITTNALQIKNVINQRTFHKMPEWRYMCEVFKSLPIWKDLGIKIVNNKLEPIDKYKSVQK